MPEYDIGFGPLRGPADGLNPDLDDDADRSLDVPNLQLSVSYIKDPKTGQQSAAVTAVWDAPSRGEDLAGKAKNMVTGYWISDRQGSISVPDLSWSAERKTTERKAVFKPLNLSTILDFRVRAQTGEGLYGPYTTKSINTAQDTTPPEAPSKAKLKPALRGVVIEWDGLTLSGKPQENDYDRTEVEISIDGGAWARIAEFGRGGGSYYYNTPNLNSRIYKARQRTIDKTGNASAYTETDPKASFDFSAAGAAAGGDNLVKNASFEDFRDPVTATPKDWARWGGSGYQEQTSRQAFHSGRSQLVGDQSGDGGYEQTVPCLPDQRYYLSGYVRAAESGRGSIQADRILSVLEDTGAEHSVTGYFSTPAVGQERGFTRLHREFTTGSSTRSLRIRTHHPAGGRMYLDAIQLDADELRAFSPKAGEIGRQTVSMEDIRDLLITTELLKDGAVTGAKVRDAAIEAAKTKLASIDPNSGELAIDSVAANQIVGGTITGIKMLAGAINTRELAADSVTGAKILAGSITASKLTIGRLGDNLVQNPGFEVAGGSGDTSADSWSFSGDGQGFRERSQAQHRTSGDWHYALVPIGGQGQIAQTSMTPVVRNKFYYMSAFLSSGGSNSFAGVYWYRNDRSYIGFSQAWNRGPGGNSGDLQQPGTVIDGQVKAPEDASFGVASVMAYGGGFLIVDEVNLREVIGTTQIMDGAITTDKVIAEGISADRIAAGRISASITLVSPLIEAGTINSGSINSGTIDGGTITGTLIATGGHAQNRVLLYDGGGARDVVQFQSDTPQGYRITGELRGGGLPSGYFYRNFQQDHGLYINSSVQIGNTQSAIHQVGKRVTQGDNADVNVRVRADHVGINLSNGVARIRWGSPMSQAPTFVVASVSDSEEGRPMVTRVSGFTSEGFDVTCFVQAEDPPHKLGRPGGNPLTYISYYAEIVL